MRHWTWVLAVSYVVLESSHTVYIKEDDWFPYACTAESTQSYKNCQEWMRDEAEALNEAHERRTIPFKDTHATEKYMGDGLGHGPSDPDAR